MNEVKVMFYNLGDMQEIQEAAGQGLLTLTDSPHGHLCTLCGVKVVAKELHIEYHRAQKDMLEALVILNRRTSG